MCFNRLGLDLASCPQWRLQYYRVHALQLNGRTMVELTGLGMWSGSIFDLGCCCIGPPGDHGGGGGASVLDPYQMFPWPYQVGSWRPLPQGVLKDP